MCIISVEIYAAIMVKVTFEIKGNILTELGKKVLPVARVIGNEQFFKVGLNCVLNFF